MKKTIMFLGVLSLGLAQAQQNDPYSGKVGINTPEPNATLDIKAHKADGSQKEGLLIPRMSKTAISKIAQPETSTLIYVNDVAYTAGSDANANTRVAKIDTVGFYYYDGTQWIWKDKYEWDRKIFRYKDGSTADLVYLINSYPENTIDYNKESGKFTFLTYKPRRNDPALFVRMHPINQNGQKETRELFGVLSSGVRATTENTSFSKLGAGLLNATVGKNVTVDELQGLRVENDIAKDGTVTKESIGIVSRLNLYEGAKVQNHTGVYSYMSMKNPKQTLTNLYYFRAGNNIGNITNYTENTYGLYIEDINSGKTSNYAIYTNTGQVRVGDLKGTGNRNVYADADGVLKAGEATNVKLGSANACNAPNAGTIRYDEVGNGSGVFGFCVKRRTDAGTDEFVWAYIKGGSNIFGTSANGATFGDGL